MSNQIDSLDAIKKLGELKELGLVTEEEFEEKKKLILLQDKDEVLASIKDPKAGAVDQSISIKSNGKPKKKSFFFSPSMVTIYFFVGLYWLFGSTDDVETPANPDTSSTYRNTLSESDFEKEGLEWPFVSPEVDFVCYDTTPFILTNNVYYATTGKGMKSHRQPSGKVSETLFAVDIMKGKDRAEKKSSSGSKAVDSMADTCLSQE